MTAKPVNTKCTHIDKNTGKACGYEFNTRSQAKLVTCPSCQYKTEAKNLMPQCDRCGQRVDKTYTDHSHVHNQQVCAECGAKIQGIPKAIVQGYDLVTIRHNY